MYLTCTGNCSLLIEREAIYEDLGESACLVPAIEVARLSDLRMKIRNLSEPSNLIPSPSSSSSSSSSIVVHQHPNDASTNRPQTQATNAISSLHPLLPPLPLQTPLPTLPPSQTTSPHPHHHNPPTQNLDNSLLPPHRNTLLPPQSNLASPQSNPTRLARPAHPKHARL